MRRLPRHARKPGSFRFIRPTPRYFCARMPTVKVDVANMLEKTGLENKLQLALAVSDAKMIADLAEE